MHVLSKFQSLLTSNSSTLLFEILCYLSMSNIPRTRIRWVLDTRVNNLIKIIYFSIYTNFIYFIIDITVISLDYRMMKGEE